MELKLARAELNGKAKSTKIDKLVEQVEKEKQKIFYFDKDNSHKDLVELVEFFEEKDYNVYFREVRYGLDEKDYMYEVHILS